MMMAIRFLHDTPIEQLDRLCKEEEYVEVMISVYHTEYYKDGTSQRIKDTGFGGQIKSSKDLIQFDDSDMKVLSRETKHRLH